MTPWASSVADVARRIPNSRVARYLRSAPLTFTWLAVLFATTVIQHSVAPERLEIILGDRSTNITHLSEDPIHVMISSLFWVDGYYWLPYFFLFCIFLAPAERWLGKQRWLFIGLLAHVLATLLSEGVLYWAIQHGHASESLINVRDIGVSYFLAGIVGVLTYRLAYPWRWVYAVALIVLIGSPLLSHITFTAIGHFSAMLIGMASYPLTRRRTNPPWNPLQAPAQWWKSHRPLTTDH